MQHLALICIPTMQGMIDVDWDKGLPPNVLPLVARGDDDLKAMREVSKTWREGFNSSVTGVRVKARGPVPKFGFFLKSPSLTSLDMGPDSMGQNRLLKILGAGPTSETW